MRDQSVGFSHFLVESQTAAAVTSATPKAIPIVKFFCISIDQPQDTKSQRPFRVKEKTKILRVLVLWWQVYLPR